MKKLAIEAISILVLFFFTWFALSEVDWMKLLRFEKISKISEEKLGELFWETFQQTDSEVIDLKVSESIDSIINRICEANNFDKSKLKIHVIQKEDINAFALPDEHLVIYTGLITDCESESELAGVISHEIAHMKLNHVMKKLGKEIGLTALISISSGNSGSEIAKQAAKILSSTAYDRKLEREADMAAADYLVTAQIDPEAFANFLFRFSETEDKINSQFSWISTHPDSKTRAEYLMDFRKNLNIEKVPILSQESWESLKNAVKAEY